MEKPVAGLRARGESVFSLRHSDVSFGEQLSRRARAKRATDEKIFRATLEIATSQGLGAVTIEEVARRSGVAKTTIYRRYADAEDLLAQVAHFAGVSGEPLRVLEPSEENLITMLSWLEERFSSEIGVRAVGVVLAGEHEFFEEVLTNRVLPLTRVFAEFLRRGQERGLFRTDVEAATVVEMIVGSVIAAHAREVMDVAVPSEAAPWAQRMGRFLWSALQCGENH